jgi:hypothetical protein
MFPLVGFVDLDGPEVKSGVLDLETEIDLSK